MIFDIISSFQHSDKTIPKAKQLGTMPNTKCWSLSLLLQSCTYFDVSTEKHGFNQ